MNPSQNVLQMSTMSPDTSREIATPPSLCFTSTRHHYYVLNNSTGFVGNVTALVSRVDSGISPPMFMGAK